MKTDGEMDESEIAYLDDEDNGEYYDEEENEDSYGYADYEESVSDFNTINGNGKAMPNIKIHKQSSSSTNLYGVPEVLHVSSNCFLKIPCVFNQNVSF